MKSRTDEEIARDVGTRLDMTVEEERAALVAAGRAEGLREALELSFALFDPPPCPGSEWDNVVDYRDRIRARLAQDTGDIDVDEDGRIKVVA